jgi:hypothetical protein
MGIRIQFPCGVHDKVKIEIQKLEFIILDNEFMKLSTYVKHPPEKEGVFFG